VKVIMSTGSHTTTLSVNGAQDTISTHAELQQHLAALPSQGYLELWLTLPGDTCISALINDGRALVIFGRYDGDAGLSSRSRDVADDSGQQMEFYLSNGQRDEYPLAWTVPTKDALAAFDYAFLYQQAAPWIIWHDDD
jgi:hypothetical protein